ncbi:cryptochrome/photolyase family protein [Henriciella mobilis]|uniref:Cryptochrome/photolyase family protein n=1 Tax=Henriciella mobilis TaxID=2305467 RepID=A0A399RL15_9PROT|nr:cryptochrome/photolyase family protein [Henriciella mobilis]RIJ32410.1 cryptochrome/photolyase family protein [Henriciella mobilis]
MTKALLIFPHHLFDHHPGLDRRPDRIVLIEDSLFFGDRQYQLQFHKQKLWLHRASMARYMNRLDTLKPPAELVGYKAGESVLKPTIKRLAKEGVTEIIACDPTDFILEKRLKSHCEAENIDLTLLNTPLFLNTPGENRAWREDHKSWFQAEFYKAQRRKLGVLMDGDKPAGGQWSFDEDNRRKVPKSLQGEVPRLRWLTPDDIEEEARRSVLEDFPDNPGSLDQLYWPTSHEAAESWLGAFLNERFERFGPYEDAILEGESLLWHSAITPMLNIGLLTPKLVLDAAISFIENKNIPMNSAEGFIRQVIGWREFMRATYEDLGVPMRTTNHWGHSRALPRSFWTGETGIPPIDDTIKRVLKTGYCHHIERLMVLGGFMFICETDPDDIYRWFMEMFADSYDWVMVPNAYAMSQNADGGRITTKPYFSGSSYVRKMSNWGTGDWCDVWDGLYWRWIWKNRAPLSGNPRWAMMVSMAEKMDAAKRDKHLENAANFLRGFH